MSETPRTLEACKWVGVVPLVNGWPTNGGEQCVVSVGFAMTLERELAAARAELERVMRAAGGAG